MNLVILRSFWLELKRFTFYSLYFLFLGGARACRNPERDRKRQHTSAVNGDPVVNPNGGQRPTTASKNLAAAMFVFNPEGDEPKLTEIPVASPQGTGNKATTASNDRAAAPNWF